MITNEFLEGVVESEQRIDYREMAKELLFLRKMFSKRFDFNSEEDACELCDIANPACPRCIGA